MRIARIVTVLFVFMLLCVLVGPVSAQDVTPDTGVDAAMPVPTYPVNAFITQKLPIYKFTEDPSALKYEVQVFTKDTHILVESIRGTGGCTTYCSLKSTIPLKTFVRDKQKGYYTWRVRPKRAGGWTEVWSDEVEFVVLSTGFTSYFSSLDPKWSFLRGTWTVTSKGYLKTLGVMDDISSTIERHLFAGQGMVYEVRFNRKVEGIAPNILYFLGDPDPLKYDGAWNTGYEFGMNYGSWYLNKRVGGTSSHIAADYFLETYYDWVKVTIWRWGSEISIWVNGDYIGTYVDSTYNLGYVGIGMVKINPEKTPLLVDWAKVYYSAYPPYAKY